jgi:ribosomal protein S12 methylthiotransferase accessory factor
LTERLADFGVTRVANVTGLDRLGVPVYMAVRPNSRSLSVSQGKGLDHDAAWVSGVMEAIELWHAERADVALELGTLSEQRAKGEVLDLEPLPHRRGWDVTRRTRMLWTTGHELASGHPVAVPYTLVHTNAVVPFSPGDELFAVTSNGLASGVCRAEAIVHGFCELVERDAVTGWQRRSMEDKLNTWIDLDTVDDPTVRRLLERCEAAEFDVLASDATSDLGIPVVVAVLLDRREPPTTLRGAAMGFGCHLRREVAFTRALTEAAQSRLTLIAGSRDDLERVDYEERRRHRVGIGVYRDLVAARKPRRFVDLADHRAERFDDQISVLLDRTEAHRSGRVVCVDLSDDRDHVAVVRVIATGLDGPDHGH